MIVQFNIIGDKEFNFKEDLSETADNDYVTIIVAYSGAELSTKEVIDLGDMISQWGREIGRNYKYRVKAELKQHRWDSKPRSCCLDCGMSDYIEIAIEWGDYDPHTETWCDEDTRQKYEQYYPKECIPLDNK